MGSFMLIMVSSFGLFIRQSSKNEFMSLNATCKNQEVIRVEGLIIVNGSSAKTLNIRQNTRFLSKRYIYVKNIQESLSKTICLQ